MRFFLIHKLEQPVADNMAFRFVAANEHPDRDTIAAFRRRLLKQIEALFVQVLLLARVLAPRKRSGSEVAQVEHDTMPILRSGPFACGRNFTPNSGGVSFAKATQANPRFSTLFAFLVSALALAGRDVEAASVARRLLELEPGFKTRNLIGFAASFAGSEIADTWAAGMRKAGLPE